MSTPLTPIQMDPPQSTEETPTASLEWESEQGSSPPRLAFRLSIANDTGSGITLQNPYDDITYSLTDAEGWPISLPQPARSARLPGPRRPKDKSDYLSVVAMELDDDRIEPEAGIDRDDLPLAPGSRLSFDFSIGHATSRDGDGIVPIAPGTYHVAVLANLRWHAADKPEQRSLIVQSEEAIIDQRGG